MNKYLFTYIVPLVLLLGGCVSTSQQNKLESVLTITIDDPAQEDHIKLADYFKSSQIISLETSIDCLLGEIYKMDKDDDYLFILDSRKQGVYCFTIQGKFLYRIGKIGNGPKELPDIQSFALDKKKNIVIIHSRAVDKMISYNYKGEVINEEPCGYIASDMEVLGEKIYLSDPNGNNEYDLVGREGESGKIVEHYIPSRYDYISSKPIFRKSNNCLYYYPNLMRDTIYTVDQEKGLQPAIVIESPEHKIPDHVWERMNNLKTRSSFKDAVEINEKGYVTLNDYAVYLDFIYLSFTYQGQVRWGFYDCKQKKLVSSYDIRDNVSYFGFNQIIGQTDTQLLTWVDAGKVDFLKELLENDKDYLVRCGYTEEHGHALLSQIYCLKEQGVGEDSNPILIIYNTK